MIKYNQLRYNDIVIRDLVVNAAYYRNFTTAGSLVNTNCADKGFCVDGTETNYFWEVTSKSSGGQNHPMGLMNTTILYDGISSTRSQQFYHLLCEHIRKRSIQTSEAQSLSSYVIATEHSQLFISNVTPDNSLLRRFLDVGDELLSVYFNTKIAHLAMHMKS